MAESLADFVADALLAFRKRVLASDPEFFTFPENQAAYQNLVQALPYVWGAQAAARPAGVVQ